MNQNQWVIKPDSEDTLHTCPWCNQYFQAGDIVENVWAIDADHPAVIKAANDPTARVFIPESAYMGNVLMHGACRILTALDPEKISAIMTQVVGMWKAQGN